MLLVVVDRDYGDEYYHVTSVNEFKKKAIAISLNVVIQNQLGKPPKSDVPVPPSYLKDTVFPTEEMNRLAKDDWKSYDNELNSYNKSKELFETIKLAKKKDIEAGMKLYRALIAQDYRRLNPNRQKRNINFKLKYGNMIVSWGSLQQPKILQKPTKF
jgi:hypothetical protein